MATVADHYRGLLSDVYSWMLGGFDAGIARNFYYKLRLAPGWIREQLAAAGFGDTQLTVENGLVTAVAVRQP